MFFDLLDPVYTTKHETPSYITYNNGEYRKVSVSRREGGGRSDCQISLLLLLPSPRVSNVQNPTFYYRVVLIIITREGLGGDGRRGVTSFPSS